MVTLLHMNVQLSQHPLLKRLPFLHRVAFDQKYVDYKYKGLFLNSQFHSIDVYVYPYANFMLS